MLESFDEYIYLSLYSLQNINFTYFMILITSMSSALFLIVTTIVYMGISKDKTDAKYFALNLGLAFLLNQFIKLIVSRPRPDIINLVSAGGYSFPSAHAMISIAFYGFTIYLINKKMKNKKLKIIFTAILIIVIILIGTSRVYLGVHYATDVVGGFIIGAIYLFLFIKFIYEKNILQKKKN